jgi:type 1 glutamine amidotransferase
VTVSRALVLSGGWEGHKPEEMAGFAITELLGDFDVTHETSLSVLEPETLRQFDLVVPIWTHGELTGAQETALCDAVEQGLGLVAWHGAAGSFRSSPRYQHLLGGQFVAHPGGDDLRYSVKFSSDMLTAGLEDFELASEQYYLLTDPAISVVATTTIDGAELTWLRGVPMPVAWRRSWGSGRVFYCALGHTIATLQQPSVQQLLRRAVAWAKRDGVRRG